MSPPTPYGIAQWGPRSSLFHGDNKMFSFSFHSYHALPVPGIRRNRTGCTPSPAVVDHPILRSVVTKVGTHIMFSVPQQQYYCVRFFFFFLCLGENTYWIFSLVTFLSTESSFCPSGQTRWCTRRRFFQSIEIRNRSGGLRVSGTVSPVLMNCRISSAYRIVLIACNSTRVTLSRVVLHTIAGTLASGVSATTNVL